MRPIPLIPFALAALVGCTPVFSEHPASDAATGPVDERLLGFWRLDWAASSTAEPTSAHGEVVFAIGIRAGSRSVLDVGIMALSPAIQGHRLQVDLTELRTSTIADRQVASVLQTTKAGAEAGKPLWVLLRYEPNESTLEVYGIDDKAVSSAIRAGQVDGHGGEVTPATTPDNYVPLTLTADTQMLRGWLETAGDAAFVKKPLVLRRLRLD